MRPLLSSAISDHGPRPKSRTPRGPREGSEKSSVLSGTNSRDKKGLNESRPAARVYTSTFSSSSSSFSVSCLLSLFHRLTFLRPKFLFLGSFGLALFLLRTVVPRLGPLFVGRQPGLSPSRGDEIAR